LGEYSPRIAPADAMVINFGVKIDLWRCRNHFPKSIDVIAELHPTT
jgi:hypothetical protein